MDGLVSNVSEESPELLCVYLWSSGTTSSSDIALFIVTDVRSPERAAE